MLKAPATGGFLRLRRLSPPPLRMTRGPGAMAPHLAPCFGLRGPRACRGGVCGAAQGKALNWNFWPWAGGVCPPRTCSSQPVAGAGCQLAADAAAAVCQPPYFRLHCDLRRLAQVSRDRPRVGRAPDLRVSRRSVHLRAPCGRRRRRERHRPGKARRSRVDGQVCPSSLLPMVRAPAGSPYETSTNRRAFGSGARHVRGGHTGCGCLRPAAIGAGFVRLAPGRTRIRPEGIRRAGARTRGRSRGVGRAPRGGRGAPLLPPRAGWPKKPFRQGGSDPAWSEIPFRQGCRRRGRAPSRRGGPLSWGFAAIAAEEPVRAGASGAPLPWRNGFFDQATPTLP